ncbi:KpsF/GutQ family sugar-phosphate isomerase [Candidatus Parcubacteria bacterium]|nr:KpsF/GutQ family sugar-phosphate isomerase [Candidatus Parcubacteria bacterium]
MKPGATKVSEEPLKEAIEALKGLRKDLSSIAKAGTLLQKRKGKIIITGVGKSAFIGMKMAATFTSLGETAIFLHPVEALHGDSGLVGKGDVLIALSFSGESSEVIRIVKYISKIFSIQVISVTGGMHSKLAKLSNVVIPINIRREGSPLNLAPMASTTASLVVGDMLAAQLVGNKPFTKNHFSRFHPGGSLGLSLITVEEIMERGSDLPLVPEGVELSRAIDAVSKRGRGVVGVMAKNKTLVGILTDGDIRRFVLKHSTIRGARVGQAMTKNPKVIGKQDSLYAALELMEQWKITNLFVVDKRLMPIGLVHMHDIVEHTLR